MAKKIEHPLDRCKRLNININIIYEDEYGYQYNNWKKGNMSWHRSYYMNNPYTELRECELCHQLSTPKKIQYRSDTSYALPWPEYKGNGMLCMSCWNKIRPLNKQLENAAEINRLIRKLQKEIRICQKSKHQDN